MIRISLPTQVRGASNLACVVKTRGAHFESGQSNKNRDVDSFRVDRSIVSAVRGAEIHDAGLDLPIRVVGLP